MEYLAQQTPTTAEVDVFRGHRMVPPCAVCRNDSTGIHFGVDSCGACSAFFRRSVVMKKTYACSKDALTGKCNIPENAPNRNKCRACRFKKCMDAGMSVKGIQPSRKNKSKISETEEDNEITVIDLEMPPPLSWTKLIQKFDFPHPNSFLNELLKREQYLKERRHLFLSDRDIHDWLTNVDETEQKPFEEVDSLKQHLFHLWTVESRLSAEYIDMNEFFGGISENDKASMFKNFFTARQAVEEPYLTWKNGGLEDEFFYQPNRRCMDLRNMDEYALNGYWKEIEHDFNMLKQIVTSMCSSSMMNVGVLMRNLKITDMEVTIIIGLILTDSAIGGIQEETRRRLDSLRHQLLIDTSNYYATTETDSQKRIQQLFEVLGVVKTQSSRNLENLKVINRFKLVPLTKVFDTILHREDENA